MILKMAKSARNMLQIPRLKAVMETDGHLSMLAQKNQSKRLVVASKMAVSPLWVCAFVFVVCLFVVFLLKIIPFYQ